MKTLKKILCNIIGHKLSRTGLWYTHNNYFKPDFYGKYCSRCDEKFEERQPLDLKRFLENINF